MAVLGGGTVALMAALLYAVFQFGNLLGPFIPFAWEKSLGDGLVEKLAANRGNRETERYLQALADRLAAHMDLPDGMTVTVHYQENKTVNALATLGGNVVIFSGLVNKLPSENGMAMVLAHEIAHVKNRHVIRAMSGGIFMSIAVAAVFGADSSIVDDLASTGGVLTALNFSRASEELADTEALAALMAEFGHVGGLGEIYRMLEKEARTQDSGRTVPAFLSSHPPTAGRIERLEALARKRGWPLKGELRPMSF